MVQKPDNESPVQIHWSLYLPRRVKIRILVSIRKRSRQPVGAE